MDAEFLGRRGGVEARFDHDENCVNESNEENGGEEADGFDGHGEVGGEEDMDGGETGGDIVDAVGEERLIVVRSDAVKRVFRKWRLEAGCVLADVHGHFVQVETCVFGDKGEGR